MRAGSAIEHVVVGPDDQEPHVTVDERVQSIEEVLMHRETSD